MFFFKMKFFPTWEDITFIRSFLTYMIRKKIENTQLLERVAIAASELISNACKHSAIDGLIFEIKQNTPQSAFILNIKNITKKEKIDEFKKIFDMINEGNPKDAYKKMMYRSLELKDINQLGLARIRYECSSKISFKILKGIKEYFTDIENIPEKENELLILSVDLTIDLNDNLIDDI